MARSHSAPQHVWDRSARRKRGIKQKACPPHHAGHGGKAELGGPEVKAVPHSRCQNDSCICSIRVVVRLVRSLPRADSAMIEALTDSRCSMPVQGVSALDLSQAKPVKTGWDGPGTESRRIGAHPASRKMVPRRCTPPMRKWPRGGDNSSRRAAELFYRV